MWSTYFAYCRQIWKTSEKCRVWNCRYNWRMAWFDFLRHIFLNCSSTNYLWTWHHIFSSRKCKIKFKNLILVAELAFCLPVTTVKQERPFSMLNRIKRDTLAVLDLNLVENVMRILQEGPPLECFEPINAMKLWANHVIWRPAGSKRHCNYEKRQSKSNNNNRESSSTDDDDDEFEMWRTCRPHS